MDKLLNPDIGLMIWTIVTFAAVLFVLGRFAWKPLLEALEAREGGIRADIKAADKTSTLPYELAPALLLTTFFLLLLEWVLLNTRFRMLP